MTFVRKILTFNVDEIDTLLAPHPMAVQMVRTVTKKGLIESLYLGSEKQRIKKGNA